MLPLVRQEYYCGTGDKIDVDTYLKANYIIWMPYTFTPICNIVLSITK